MTSVRMLNFGKFKTRISSDEIFMMSTTSWLLLSLFFWFCSYCCCEWVRRTREWGWWWGVDELKSGKRKEQWLTNCYRWFGIASRTTCKTNTKCTWYLLTEASCCSLVDWLCRVRLQLKCDPLGRVPIYLSEKKVYPNAISNRIRCGSM